MSMDNYEKELVNIQVSLALPEVKEEAVDKLNKKYGRGRDQAMVENGDTSDISSSY